MATISVSTSHTKWDYELWKFTDVQKWTVKERFSTEKMKLNLDTIILPTVFIMITVQQDLRILKRDLPYNPENILNNESA